MTLDGLAINRQDITEVRQEFLKFCNQIMEHAIDLLVTRKQQM